MYRIYQRSHHYFLLLFLLFISQFLHAQSPNADFSANITSGCAPLPVQFVYTGTGNVVTYKWRFGDGDSSAAINPNHVYNRPGIYTVTLEVISDNGQSDTEQKVGYIQVNGPMGTFSGNPRGGCNAPITVQFTAGLTSPTSQITSWSWTFGDGFTSNQPNPSHTYTSTGNFDVELVVVDNQGCSKRITEVDYIQIGAPTASFTPSVSTTCAGSNISFTNNSTGADTYTWNFGDGTMSTDANPTHIYDDPGNYIIQLFAENSLTGCNETFLDTLTITAGPVVNFSSFPLAPVTACSAPLSVSFFDISTGAVTWLWEFGDGNTSTQQNPTHIYQSVGQYDVSLTVTDVSGCEVTRTETNFVEIVDIQTAITADVQSGCIPLDVQFNDATVSTDSVFTRIWQFGDGSQAFTIPNPTHQYTNVGSYDVSLILITEKGCRDTLTMPDFIQAGDLPTADFFAINTVACVVDPINFLNLSSPVDGNTAWEWDFGDGNGAAVQNPSYTYSDTGNYSVSLVMDNLGCRDTLSRPDYITILEPVALFSFQPDHGCGVSPTVSFIDESISPTDWIWDFGDGNTSTQQNPTHTYSNPGTYNVTLIVSNGNTACMDELTQVIQITNPTADFSANQTLGCRDLDVTFTNLSSGTTQHIWSFGDGATSTDYDPTHTYTTPGIYDVTLIVADSFGCVDTIVKPDYITVTGPIVNFNSNAQSGCVPLSVPFFDQSIPYASTSIVSWLWDFGDSTSSTQQNPTHIYTTEGLYTVSLTVTDSDGCSYTHTKPFFIQPSKPNAEFIADVNSGCIPLTVNFLDLSTAVDTIDSWVWDFGDGTILFNTQNPTHTYTTSGNFSVTLTVFSRGGCQDTLTLANYIQAGFQPSVSFVSTNPSACASDGISFLNFTNPFNDSTRWMWHFGDGGTSSDMNPTYTYTDTGQFNVKLVVDNFGCKDSLTDPSPVTISGPIADFSIGQFGSCSTPVNVQFNDASIIPETWVWDFGDGGTSSAQNPNHTYVAPGTYTVTLTVDNSSTACNASLQRTIEISTLASDFSASPTNGCRDLDVSFTNASTSSTSQIWDFGDGHASTEPNPTHTYTDPGIYDVTLIAADTLGCSDTLQRTSYVTVRGPRVDFATADSIGCPPLTANFSDISIAFGSSTISSWSWDFGDGTTATGSNPSHTYTIGGNYDVTLSVTDSDGCSYTLTKENYIRVVAPVVDFTVADTFGCPSLIAEFTDASVGLGFLTYQWDFGHNSSTSLQQNPTYTYDSPGVYDVKLVVTDILGCKDSLTKPGVVSVCLTPSSAFACDSLANCSVGSMADVDISNVDEGYIMIWDSTLNMFEARVLNVDDADAEPTNELNTALSLNGTQLELEDPGGTLSVDLSPLQDGVDDADADPSNELQDLTQLGNTLALSNSSSTVDLTPYLDNTDNQTLTWDSTNQSISITGGNNINLTGITGAGTSLWQQNGTDIYYEDNFVGIGTQTPQSKLHIEDNTLGTAAALQINGSDDQSPAGYALEVKGHPSGNPASRHTQLTTAAADSRMTLKSGDDADFAPRLQMTGAGESNSPGWAIFDYGSRLIDLPSASFKMRFMPTTGSPVDMIHAEGTDGVYLAPTQGNVGIGTISPQERLHIAGSIRSDDLAGGGNIIADANGTLMLGPADSDGDSLNEVLQTASLNGNTLELTDAGGTLTVDLSSLVSTGGSGNDDDWAFTSGNGLNDPIYHTGDVGIGTLTPQSKLHVSDGAVLFSGTIGSTPIAGAGTRMMWIPEKAAFRAGTINGTQWNDPNIGMYSTAFGLSSIASGIASTSLGRDNEASGVGATTIGRNNTASGDGATTIGFSNTASGEGSTALGFSTDAQGYAATTMGLSTTASGDYSLAIGSLTTASGFNATAMGLATTASGNYATALGASSIASGNHSFAAGENSEAFGHNSTSVGQFTQASFASLAIGRYNDDTGNMANWNTADYVFTIGDGTSPANRSNAMYVQKNGDVWIQGTLSQFSDVRLKNNIQPLEGVMNKIMQLNGVNYEWKDTQQMGDRLQLGLIAQDLEKVYPELITEVEGYKSVNYIGLIPVLIEATKDQEHTISSQESLIQLQAETIKQLQADMLAIQTLLNNVGLMTDTPPTLNNVPSTPKESPSTPPQVEGNYPQLYQNVPNPFNETTNISYYLPAEVTSAKLIVYEMSTGNIVKQFNIQDAGYGAIKMASDSLSSGVYAYSLYVDGNRVGTRRMILVD